MLGCPLEAKQWLLEGRASEALIKGCNVLCGSEASVSGISDLIRQEFGARPFTEEDSFTFSDTTKPLSEDKSALIN